MQNLSKLKRLRRAVDPAPELDGFDARTGLAGRALLLSRLERQWVWCSEKQLTLCVLMINLGIPRKLKIDESPAMDRLLVESGQVLSNVLRRRADFAGHVRAGEFCAILSDVQPDGASHVAEMIVESVRDARIQALESKSTVRVSVGGACYVPTSHHFAKTMVAQADAALKEAVDLGGDRAIVYDVTKKPDAAHGGW